MENIQLFQGDCLEIMKQIPNKSIGMILCDLPIWNYKKQMGFGY